MRTIQAWHVAAHECQSHQGDGDRRSHRRSIQQLTGARQDIDTCCTINKLLPTMEALTANVVHEGGKTWLCMPLVRPGHEERPKDNTYHETIKAHLEELVVDA